MSNSTLFQWENEFKQKYAIFHKTLIILYTEVTTQSDPLSKRQENKTIKHQMHIISTLVLSHLMKWIKMNNAFYFAYIFGMSQSYEIKKYEKLIYEFSNIQYDNIIHLKLFWMNTFEFIQFCRHGIFYLKDTKYE